MPEASLAFSFDEKTPAELETRRREIVERLQTEYQGYDDPEIPTSLLQELSALTGAVRRRTAGPPKKAKSPKDTKRKPSVDDLLTQLGS